VTIFNLLIDVLLILDLQNSNLHLKSFHISNQCSFDTLKIPGQNIVIFCTFTSSLILINVYNILNIPLIATDYLLTAVNKYV
jgi:hypothetical protein